MRRRVIVIAATLALYGSLTPVSDGLAQSSTPPPTGTAAASTGGALDKLPSGEQTVARALWEAQAGQAKLTVDEIATLKLSGTTWGEIFAEFMVRELVTEKKIQQIMRRYKAELAQAARVPQ